MLTRVRAFFAQGNRSHSVVNHYSWFLAGYRQAIADIDRTGLRPLTDKTIKESVDRALRRWVDTGSMPGNQS